MSLFPDTHHTLNQFFLPLYCKQCVLVHGDNLTPRILLEAINFCRPPPPHHHHHHHHMILARQFGVRKYFYQTAHVHSSLVC